MSKRCIERNSIKCKGNEKEEYTETLVRESNSLAERLLEEISVEGSF